MFRQCRFMEETISALADWLHTYRGAKLKEVINIRFTNGDRDIVRRDKTLYDAMIGTVMLFQEHSLEACNADAFHPGG